MRTYRRTRRPPGVARKGSRARPVLERHPLPRREGRLSERGRTTSQAVAKRRARSLKRETGSSKEGKGAASQGQRKAIRGNRTRQRRT
jgi:hypothetical protein